MIGERLKTVAKQKIADTKAGIQKEKEYQRFKHPTVGYLKTGKTTTDYTQSEEFGKRLEKEKTRAAQKKVKRAERRTAIKSMARTKYKEMKAESKKPRKQSDPIFGMGQSQSDPIGFGSGLDLGMGKSKKKGKEFSLW